MINVMFYAYFAKTSKVRVLFKYFIYFWNKTEKMITIKCFGKVEISGDVQLPLNVAIESTDEISVTSENKLITSENKLITSENKLTSFI